MAPGPGRLLWGRGRTEADPLPQEPEGSNSQALTLEGFKGLGLGAGLLGPASPKLNMHLVNPGARLAWTPAFPSGLTAGSRSTWASKPLALA